VKEAQAIWLSGYWLLAIAIGLSGYRDWVIGLLDRVIDWAD
jgi:hypothetical protein